MALAAQPMLPSLPARYRLLRPLGQGGEGQVWLVADDSRGGASYALKLVSLGSRPARVQGRVREEFLTLLRVAHPNIARVEDFGWTEEGGSAYFTTEAVAGGNLLEHMAAATASSRWHTLLDLAGQALCALHHLAVRGLSHGDIKPANLLVQPPSAATSGRPVLKLIDFGLAHAHRAAGSGPPLGGTPAYCAPAREAGLEDAGRRDLYALGLSLYHAGAGTLPFRLGEPADRERWQRSGEPARLRAARPEAPELLDDLVAGLTAPGRLGRIESAQEGYRLLARRGALPPPWTLGGHPAISFGDLIEPLARELTDALTGPPGGGPPVFFLPGPAEASDEELLSALTRRLRIEGFECLQLGGGRGRGARGGEGQPLGLDGGASAAEAESSNLGERARALLGAARGRPHVVLVDGAPGAPGAAGEAPPAGWRLALALLEEARRQEPASLALLWIGSAEGLRAAGLGGTSRSPRELRRPTLGPGAVEDLLKTAFAAEDTPRELVAQMLRETGGSVASLQGAFDVLESAGAKTDELGRLSVPGAIPSFRPGAPSPGPGLLPPRLRVLYARFAAAEEPLDAVGCARRFPSISLTEWTAALETFQQRGMLRRIPLDVGRAGWLPLDPGRSPWSAELPVAEASALHERLAVACLEDLRAGAPARGWLRRARALHLLRLGRWRESGREALRAARSLKAQGEPATGAELLLEVANALAPAPQGVERERLAPVLLLQAARRLLRMGQASEALSTLEAAESRLGGRGGLLRAGVVRTRVEGLEALGRIEEARTILEELDASSAAPPLSSREGLAEALRRLERRARLAALRFKAGAAVAGRRLLDADLEELRQLHAGCREDAFQLASLWSQHAALEQAHGTSEAAILCLESARRLTPGAGRSEKTQAPLNSLAIEYARRQDWEKAQGALEELERWSLAAGDPGGVLKAVFNRAIIHYRRSHLPEAEALFRRARDLAQELGRRDLLASVETGFAGVLRERGRVLEALRLYRRVTRPGSQAPIHERALAHNNLSDLYLSLGRPARALEHAAQASRAARQGGRRFLQSLALRTRGAARCALGRVAAAEHDLLRARGAAEEEGDLRGAAEAGIHLGTLLGAQGQTGDALRAWRRALAASRAARDVRHELDALTLILAELLARGRFRAARRLLPRLRRGVGEELRGGIRVAALSLMAGERPLTDATPLLEAAREAERRGSVWETYTLLRVLAREPRLPPGVAAAIQRERQRLELRILGRVPRRSRNAFESLWGEAPAARGEGERSSPAASERVPAALGASSTAHRWTRSELEALAAPVPRLDHLVELLREELGASAAGLIASDAPLDLPPALRRGLVDARRSRAPILADEHVLWRLPGAGKDAPVLWVRGVVSTPEDGAGIESLLFRPALPLILALRLEAAQRDTARAASRRGELEKELERLHALLSQGARELETELLSQNLRVRDLKIELEARVQGTQERARLVGSSPFMRQLFPRLARIAAREISVLIVGESGVGKDLVARWIHDLSPRAEGSYVAESCSIPESLMEAELFGSVRGAFTDAIKDRPGLFERAKGGTVYLDEVAALPPSLQARLLRVLETREVRPLGAEAPRKVDFRLLASSARSVAQLSDAAVLRQDLLYRINAEVLEIPPLRERPEDVPVLVEEALRRLSARSGKEAPRLRPGVLDRLARRAWPGNVRELFNEVERLVVLHPREIPTEAVPDGPAPGPGTVVAGPSGASLPRKPGPLVAERDRIEREIVLAALVAAQGNATEAARVLEITRRHLGTLLQKHKIDLQELKGPASPPPSHDAPQSA